MIEIYQTSKTAFFPTDRKPLKISFGNCTYMPGTQNLEIDGNVKRLSKKLALLLEILYSHHEIIVPKKVLIKSIWEGRIVDEGGLKVAVSRLRKLIDPQYILTVHGVGYKLVI